MESPTPSPSESSHEAFSEPPADVEVPTLLDDLKASRRQIHDLLQRFLGPLRARLTAPIRPGSWLGLTILAVNPGLFLLAFRSARTALQVGFIALLGVTSGWHGQR